MFRSAVNPQGPSQAASFNAWAAHPDISPASPVRHRMDDCDTVRAMFQRAEALALEGRHEQAREICAEAILQYQPLLAPRTALLRAAFAALIVARGFKLLARLAQATSGRRIKVTVSEGAPLQPPLRRQKDRSGVVIYTIDGGQLACLSAQHKLAQRWSAELASDTDDDAAFDMDERLGKSLAFA